MSTSYLNRRHFIKNSLLVILMLPLMGFFRKVLAEKKDSSALPVGAVAVSESDAVAVAIGYKAHIADIDFAKYPQRKKPDAQNQFCKNCALYVPSNAGWGKCQMLTTGLVASTGWCGSWSKKA